MLNADSRCEFLSCSSKKSHLKRIKQMFEEGSKSSEDAIYCMGFILSNFSMENYFHSDENIEKIHEQNKNKFLSRIEELQGIFESKLDRTSSEKKNTEERKKRFLVNKNHLHTRLEIIAEDSEKELEDYEISSLRKIYAEIIYEIVDISTQTLKKANRNLERIIKLYLMMLSQEFIEKHLESGTGHSDVREGLKHMDRNLEFQDSTIKIEWDVNNTYSIYNIIFNLKNLKEYSQVLENDTNLILIAEEVIEVMEKMFKSIEGHTKHVDKVFWDCD